jgi:hypothetical protein
MKNIMAEARNRWRIRIERFRVVERKLQVLRDRVDAVATILGIDNGKVAA